MFSNNSQSLVHLPGKPQQDHEPQLPRGECGFILPEPEHANGGRQRCQCRSFYPDSVVRSRCGCGHQAWSHEAQPLASVSLQEHIEVVEEVKRLRDELKRFAVIEQELAKERMMREDRERMWKGIEERLYNNMRFLKVHLDDKVEAVVDKTQECHNEIKAVQERLIIVDESAMSLEDRVERLEFGRGSMSRSMTPVVQPAQTPKQTPKVPHTPIPQLPQPMQMQTISELPIRTEKRYPQMWSTRVIFVPRRAQRFAYDPDSNGYRRCQSRNLQQTLDFSSQDSGAFVNGVEASFKGILRGRSWMPLTGHRPDDEPFGRMALRQLPSEFCTRDVWDYPFLEDHCIAHDKMQGDVLYIALQFEDATWHEIRFLPPVLGADELCWNHDEELDGSISGFKSLDTELMYDYQQDPPPYSSRLSRASVDRTPSKLDVLADSASMLSRVERTNTATTTYSSERSSLRSFETEGSDDEHRDKKPRMHKKASMPSLSGSSSASAPVYISGRSKRKITVREKGPKEPLHFNVSNVAKWRPNLLHPTHSKEKAADTQ
ncbi:uncharacterized protein BDZ99DRAFT_457331 [Mytilinidion resinicola]|uniref:Uncharacterized protein n=1 Tax=Mytilinidion resinicola TaxID=574789 RepID=A0A6A6ZBL2_9PEZI|nr:uncharacterized protein BDZ99DRAFT_457331 [Mytilinidion resinicola]KAF2817607.1 hypothetical protein BDZ99DRAFT_457331 [Mytilinidion resinicola]